MAGTLGQRAPRDPYVAPNGDIWFVGQGTHYIARLDPNTGKFWRRELDDGAGPHNLIVGKDGVVWYAGNRRGYIGRLDPRTDNIEKIKMPDRKAGDPHTLVFRSGPRILDTPLSEILMHVQAAKTGAA